METIYQYIRPFSLKTEIISHSSIWSNIFLNVANLGF